MLKENSTSKTPVTFDPMLDNNVNNNTTQIVLTALLFDSLFQQEGFLSHSDYASMLENGDERIFEVEESSIQFDVHLHAPGREPVEIHRNLNPVTQKVFGLKFEEMVQLQKVEQDSLFLTLRLVPTDCPGPKIAQKLVELYLPMATFSFPMELPETEICWFGLSLAFIEGLPMKKSADRLSQRDAAVTINSITKQLNELDVMCKMGGSYAPYIDLLESKLLAPEQDLDA